MLLCSCITPLVWRSEMYAHTGKRCCSWMSVHSTRCHCSTSLRIMRSVFFPVESRLTTLVMQRHGSVLDHFESLSWSGLLHWTPKILMPVCWKPRTNFELGKFTYLLCIALPKPWSMSTDHECLRGLISSQGSHFTPNSIFALFSR